MGFLVIPHPCQHLVFSENLILASGCKIAFWSNDGVLFCTSVINDVEHFLVCILAICILSFVRCLFKSLAYILIGVLSCVTEFFFLKKLFIYLFIFGCVGSSFLCEGFL